MSNALAYFEDSFWLSQSSLHSMSAFVQLSQLEFSKELERVKAKFNPLSIQVVNSFPAAFEDPDYWYFLHGTSTELWNGTEIIIPEDRSLDFGFAFYAFGDEQRGRIAAMQWAHKKQQDEGGEGVLIRLRMKKSEFESLSIRRYMNPQATDEFLKLVRESRSGKAEATPEVDIIHGPTAIYDLATNQWVKSNKLPPQFAFRTADAVSKLTIDRVLPLCVPMGQVLLRSKL